LEKEAMPDFIMSGKGNQFLNLILSWENDQRVMREQDDRFVRAKMLIDGHDYIFFFHVKGLVYGANENARSVFSIMKNPMGEVGYKDMNFQASNLSKAMAGEPKEEIFIYKDVNRLKVIQKEDAYQMLMKTKKSGKSDEVTEKMNAMRQNRSFRDKKNKDGRITLNKDFEEL
jgi:hypothetical protein